jgi:ABC-type microcin C transport system permease subunit YejB
VWQLIREKLPVSISLGLWTFFISYGISVPLGVAKAVRAGSRFDLVTTLLVLAATPFRASCWAWRCWSSSAGSGGFRCAG